MLSTSEALKQSPISITEALKDSHIEHHILLTNIQLISVGAVELYLRLSY